MAGVALETTVTMSEMVVGRTVFDIEDESDRNFIKVSIGQDRVLPLQPVHYHYVDPVAKHPRRFAVIGEYPLAGKRVTLIG